MSSTTDTHDGARTAMPISELVGRIGPVTLLAVWSHPDDESLLAGGLLAEIARRGGRIVNVSATSGEHGTDDPVTMPPSVLAELREAELEAALAELGVGPSIGLGIEDGRCDEVSDRDGAALVGALIDRVRPDAVLGFGPDGVTGHPDHRAVGRWTRRAVADRHRIPLLTTSAASAWPADGIEGLRSIDAFWPGFPDHVPSVTELVVRLGDVVLERKLAALSRHGSQMSRVVAALGPDRFRALAETEAYRAANAAAAALVARRSEQSSMPVTRAA